ncbi:hypothetical protein ACVWWN_003498 [Mycobacterium sp. URHB0021]
MRCGHNTQRRWGRAADAVPNAVPGGAAAAMTALADCGRLATITPDPPVPTRGITVTTVYLRSDGANWPA